MVYLVRMKPQSVISISTGTFLKAAGIVVLLWFVWYIRSIVAIFLVSLLLAALIEPFADWFSKRNIPRSLAVLIVYVVLIAFLTVIGIVLIPVIANQFSQLIANISVFSKEAADVLAQFQTFSAQHGLSENLAASIQSIEDGFSKSVGSLFTTVTGLVSGIATIFIILVLTFYMVADGEKMTKYFKSLAPVEYQPYVSELLKKLEQKIGAWLRGQFLLGFVIGLASFIGLSILGVRYALLLAIIAGFCEMIPYVGPVFSAIPAMIIAFAQAPALALVVGAMYLVIQQLENHLLVPKIMQKVTGLNPIVSIVALLVGVKVGGIFGAFFAIPIATMIMVILDDIFKEHRSNL